MAEKYNLPVGWKQKAVGELYNVVGGGTPSTSISDYWDGNIPWVSSADIFGLKDIRPRKQITTEAIENSATNLVPAGSIIVVTRVGLGKVALTDKPLTFSQDSQALIEKENIVLPEYALYYLAQATQAFKYQGRGTTISGVTKKQLKDLPFPLPPFSQQVLIVTKIEELFTQLDAGTAALKRVQAGLKRYKASVLKAGVTGLYSNTSTGDAGLPQSWQWSTIGGVVESMKNGIYKPADYYSDDGIACLRMYNIEDGIIVWKDIKRMILTKEEIEMYQLLPGDILVNRVNSRELVGKAAVIPDGLETTVYESKNIRLRINNNIASNKFVNYCFSAFGQQYFNFNAQQVVGMASINQSQIANMPIPLPPLAEQLRIVEIVEQKLSVVSKIEVTTGGALTRGASLRQAILKQAFEGKLL